MTAGTGIGAVLGAGIGYAIAVYNPPMGVVYAATIGATIGAGVGSLLDPIDSNSKIGEPEDEFTVNTTSKGLPIPDVLGITHLGGNVLWYGDRDEDKEKEDDQKYYVYYLTWWLGICKGPVDVLHAVYKDSNLIWQGYETLASNPSGSVTISLGESVSDPVTTTLTDVLTFAPYHWWLDDSQIKIEGHDLQYYDALGRNIQSITLSCNGGSTTYTSLNFTSEEYGKNDRNITLVSVVNSGAMGCGFRYDETGVFTGVSTLTLTVVYDQETTQFIAKGEELGDMIFYFGTDDQVDVGSGDDRPTMNMRGLCWASFENCLLGTYPTAPNITFVVGKYPTFSAFDNPNSRVNTVNYNFAHALYYMLTVPGGMPPTLLHTDSLDTMADTLFSEGLGGSFLMNGNAKVFSYVEGILKHIDAAMVYKTDSNGDPKFHFKLFRGDEDTDNLPIVGENVLLEEPSLTRRSWIETYNEIKAKHFDVVGDVAGLNWVIVCGAIGEGTCEVNGNSFDLMNWNEGEFNEDYTHIPYALAFIDDLDFYISVGNGTGKIQTSKNGDVWQWRYHTIIGDYFISVGGGGGSDGVMVGGRHGTSGSLGYSPSGSDWVDKTPDLPSPIGNIEAIVYDTEHSLWIIGSTGTYNRARIITSGNDGDTFTSQWSDATGVTRGPKGGECYDGTTIMVGHRGDIWRSVNGTTWTELNCGENVTLTSVTCKEGIWVIVGYNGSTPYMFKSADDGLTWLQITQPTTMTVMNDVFSDGVLFIVVGFDAQIWKSSDGIDWYEIDHGMYDSTYDFTKITKRTE